jgi:hypothetical protein
MPINCRYCVARYPPLRMPQTTHWRHSVPDDIDVSVPGSSAIATEALLEQHDLLGHVEFLLRATESLVHEAEAVGAITVGRSFGAAQAESELARCARELRIARSHTNDLRAALSTAAAHYGAAERFAEQLVDTVVGVGATAAGTAVGELLSLLGPAAYLLPIVFHQDASHDPSGPSDIQLPADINRTLTDPGTVNLIRAGATGVDDFFRALNGLPMPLNDYLGTGDDEAGQVAAGAAALLVGGRLFGLFGATPTKATLTDTSESSSTPSSIGELISNIPGPDPGEHPGNFRIDHIVTDGQHDKYIVYIGGTDDFSPVSRDRALDLTSGVEAIAGAPTGSMQSLDQAMKDSGISHTSAVTFVGYSHGALLASAATASGAYTVDGLVTIGNPAGNIETPANVPAILIGHDDDLVTALGGNQTNDNALRITRRVFGSAAEIPADMPVPAHHREYYQHTAELVDASTSDDVSSMVAKLTSYGTDASHVETRWYDATRVQLKN